MIMVRATDNSRQHQHSSGAAIGWIGHRRVAAEAQWIMVTMSRRIPVIAGWTGLVLMLVPLYWFIASGLLAPLWAIVGLLVIWGAALVWGIIVRRRWPWVVLALPVALMLLWLVVITIGERLLGWTA